MLHELAIRKSRSETGLEYPAPRQIQLQVLFAMLPLHPDPITSSCNFYTCAFHRILSLWSPYSSTILINILQSVRFVYSACYTLHVSRTMARTSLPTAF